MQSTNDTNIEDMCPGDGIIVGMFLLNRPVSHNMVSIFSEMKCVERRRDSDRITMQPRETWKVFVGTRKMQLCIGLVLDLCLTGVIAGCSTTIRMAVQTHRLTRSPSSGKRASDGLTPSPAWQR